MKKLLVFFLAAFLAFGSLCGCGSEPVEDLDNDRESVNYTDDDYTDDDYMDGDDYTDGDDYADGDDYTDGDDYIDGEEYSLLEDDTIYFFVLDGQTFKVGDEISDMTAVGYELLSGNRELAPEEHDAGGMAPSGENIAEFYISVYNSADVTVKYSDAVIGGFKLRGLSATNEIVKNAEVYGGIMLGSSREDVTEAFGEPTSVMDTTYIYRTGDSERFYKFNFDEDWNVNQIEWTNYTFDANAWEDEEIGKNTETGEGNAELSGTKDKSLLKPYLGMWEYENENLLIGFEADFTWRMYDNSMGEKEKVNAGTFTVDASRVYLYDKNDAFVMSIESISMNQLTDDAGEDLYRYIAN